MKRPYRARDNFILPLRSQLAWKAFTARLVLEKVRDAFEYAAQIRRIVQHHDRAGAERRADCGKRLKVERDVDLVRAGFLHLPADTHHAYAGRFCRTVLAVRLRAFERDERNVCERLDVVDD